MSSIHSTDVSPIKKSDNPRVKEALEIIPWLADKLEQLFPDDKYAVTVRVDSIIGFQTLYIDVQNETRESMKKSNVAFWNATVSFRLSIRLTDPGVKEGEYNVEMYNQSYQTRDAGLKFRKIKAKDIKEASTKLVEWFKKNKETIDSIPVSESSPSKKAK